MKERKIIHISDFHISSERESILQNDNYRHLFLKEIKKFRNLDTCIISGDLVDKGGGQDQFKLVGDFMESLKLEIPNILIVPGNHEVNRGCLAGIAGKSGIIKSELWSHQSNKLTYYLEFMEAQNLEANPDSALMSKLILRDPDIIILGLNSTWKIGMEDNSGYIDIETLKKALKDLMKNDDYKSFIKVAVFHHNPIIYESPVQSFRENNYENDYGTCNHENWQAVKELLLSYDIHIVLTGHVHGTQSGSRADHERKNDNMYFSTVGSVGVNFNYELLDLLGENLNKEFKDKLVNLKSYQSIYNNHNSFNILTFDQNGLVREEQYKFIVDEGRWKWVLWQDKDLRVESAEDIYDFAQEDNQTDIFGQPQNNVPLDNTRDHKTVMEQCEKAVLDIVRDQKLYKTGHFHWKGVAMLNWIDTSYFFSNRKEMQRIAIGFYSILNHEIEAFDCIIGIGIKGSIILSYIRYLLPEVKSSYYPESSKGYNIYEKAFLKDNGNKVKDIILLTDVVHSGNTVKTFVRQNRPIISEDTQIEVITIFNATTDGQSSIEFGTLSIKLHCLAKLKVSNCNGSGSDCPIYTQKLAPVYEYIEQEEEDVYEYH